jgi:hypothetical protein
VGTPQLYMVAGILVANLAAERSAYIATSEDEEGYVEGLRQSVRLEGDSTCKVDRIYKGVRIRKNRDL